MDEKEIRRHLAKKLKLLRKAKNLNVDQVGAAIGKSGKTISAWEVGRGEPDADELIKLCKLFDAKIKDFYDAPVAYEYHVIDLDETNKEFINLPVLGEIAAGIPIDMLEIDAEHPCPTAIAEKHPNSGWLKVKGDSYNKKIPNGCLALVDFDLKEPQEHTPFAVCVNGYSATIKNIKQLANGFELIPNSYDPTYTPTIYDYNKDDTELITIIGQVVYASFPLDWEA